ncbi:MAG: hypothetical protein ACR2QM_11250 [Longimicrobiales bacterium]
MTRFLLSLAAVVAAAACSGGDAPAPAVATEASNPLADYEPSGTQGAEVQATLQQLFDALETGDEALLRSVVDPSVVMHFSETRDGQTTFGSATLDGLATRITSSEVPLIERMWDPVVAVDGPLATIWTPYDFYAGEAFSHCGVDAANLLRSETGWTIVALSWTRMQPPACDLHPDGPPGA